MYDFVKTIIMFLIISVEVVECAGVVIILSAGSYYSEKIVKNDDDLVQ